MFEQRRVLSRQMLGSEAQPLCFPRRISFKGAPSEEHVRDASLGLLTGYLGPIVDAIVGSVGRCPPAMRLVFKQLRQCVEERFPQAEHEVGHAIMEQMGTLRLGRGRSLSRVTRGGRAGRGGDRPGLPALKYCVSCRKRGWSSRQGLGSRGGAHSGNSGCRYI